MTEEGVNQMSLADISGVDQASLSRFLREENPEGLSGENVMRLLSIVPSSALPPSPFIAGASPEART